MNRSERREFHRVLEGRILAGERKVDIVGQAAVEGEDWMACAREVALIPTPANRHRWRWLNRALLVLLAATAAAEAVGLLAVETGAWLAIALVYPFLFVGPLRWVAHYQQRGYGLAASAGIAGLFLWLYLVGWRAAVPAPTALTAVVSTLCALVIVVALVTQRLLLPESRFWDMAPKTDAAGTPLFEE